MCLYISETNLYILKFISGNQSEAQTKERTDPLEDLAALGTSLIKQNLPSNIPVQVQFKSMEKLSMNQMKQQQLSATSHTPVTSTTSRSPPVGLALSSPLQFPARGSPASTTTTGSARGGDPVDSLLSMNLLSGDKSATNVSVETKTSLNAKDKVNLLEDSCLLDSISHSDSMLEAHNANVGTPEASKPTQDITKSENQDRKRRTSSTSNPQFMEVKPMTDLKVTLDSIKPGKYVVF